MLFGKLKSMQSFMGLVKRVVFFCVKIYDEEIRSRVQVEKRGKNYLNKHQSFSHPYFMPSFLKKLLITIKFPPVSNLFITLARRASTMQKVPDLPMPALQWTTAGPLSLSRTPEALTAYR